MSLLDDLTKDLGGLVRLTPASELEDYWEDRLSTGVPSIDAKLLGGYPRGCISQLHGPPGAGKDLLINLCMAEVQRRFENEAKIMWLSFGYALDVKYAQMCGVSTDPEVGGMLVAVDLEREKDAIAAPAETLMTAAIKAVETGQFHLVIVNELGSGETKDNVKKELNEELKIGTWARLMTSFCQRFYTAVRLNVEGTTLRNKTTVLVANPQRANISTNPYLAKFAPTKATSGHALSHAKAVDIWLKAKNVKNKDFQGKEIVWKLKKAKHGLSEGEEGQFLFEFNKGVDIIADLANICKQLDIIVQRGKLYDIPTTDGLYSVEGGLKGVIAFLKEECDPVDIEHLRALVVDKSKKKS